MPFPFEVPFDQVKTNLDTYVDEVFQSLQSDFMILPKGPGFVEYPVFEQGYEALKKATQDFRNLSPDALLDTVYRVPIAFIVLRAMLGFTPPEWAYVTTQRADIGIPQGAVRSLDRRIRLEPLKPLRNNGSTTNQRIRALIATACDLLKEGAPAGVDGVLHRLDKADTRSEFEAAKRAQRVRVSATGILSGTGFREDIDMAGFTESLAEWQRVRCLAWGT